MAQAAGDTSTYRTFLRRAQNWQNLFDPATGYLAARRADGTFPPGPAFQRSSLPGIGQVGFEEGNAIQYTWSVPQNLRGLFDVLGGNGAVVSKLDTFFTQLNAGRKQPYDWAGDEPSLGIPWVYDYAGAPWQTQDVVRRIVTTLYGPTPDGEPGNDDLGAMSSWYVWAAMGLYPETPGRGELVLAQPPVPPHHRDPRPRPEHRDRRTGGNARHPLRPKSRRRGRAGHRRCLPGGLGRGPGALPVPVVARHGVADRSPARLHPGTVARHHLGWGTVGRAPSFPAG